MSHRLIIRPEAEADIDEAASWYEEQREGLGDEFLRAVDECLARIVEYPLAYQLVHRNTRRNLLSRFPYAIHYVIEDDEISVIACMHGKRHPRRWQKRI